MKLSKYMIATTEMLLVFPALLFMTALFVRNLQPRQFEPAHSAQQIVDWYAARPHVGLWVLLVALPLVVFVSGLAALWHRWQRDADLRRAAQQFVAAIREQTAALLLSLATLAAGGVLAIVALHVMTD